MKTGFSYRSTDPSESPNQAASRTLDSIARSTKPAAASRQRLWPDLGWRKHLPALLVVLSAMVLAYSNSVTTLVAYNDAYPDIGYTLDNKYIIQFDPRTKADTWNELTGKAGMIDLFTKDYWWPKGISGLYRPIISFTYWLNWHVIGGDESKIDADIDARVDRKLDSPARIQLLRGELGDNQPGDEARLDLAGQENALRDKLRERLSAHIRHRRYQWFHIVNLISHGIAAVLVYFAGLHLTKRYWTALAIATLFSVHPITVESVTNIIGRADIFAAIAVLGGLLLYARATVARGVWKVPWLIALGLVTLFGLFCKESAIVVVPVLLLYDLIYRWDPKAESWNGLPARLWRWSYSGYVAWVLPVVAMFVVRHYVFAATTPPEEPFLDNPIRGVNWLAGRLTAIQVTTRFWALLSWPMHLSCDYSFKQIPPVLSTWSSTGNNLLALGSMVLMLAVILLAIWLWHSGCSKAAAFFILFFFATYVLTSNLIYTIGSVMAERFMYLPVIGFLGCLVILIDQVARSIVTRLGNFNDDDRRLVGVGIASTLAAMIAVSYGVRTFIRNNDWRSDLTLWASALVESPMSFRSYQSYAFALWEEFQKPEDKRQPDARGVTIDRIIPVAQGGRPIVDSLPDKLNSSRLYLHLGLYWSRKGDELCQRPAEANQDPIVTPEAAACYEKSIEALEKGTPIDRAFSALNRQKEIQRGKNPADIADVGLLQIYEYKGNSYMQLKQHEKALEAFQYMRRLDATNPDAYVKIASVYALQLTPDAARMEPRKRAANAELAAIALIQALWLDGNRKQLWQPLSQLLAQINPESSPAVIWQQGNPRLDIQRQVVRSVLCSAYQSFVRVFLESKLVSQAELMRALAVRDAGFPQSLFDDIFKQFNRVPPPIPPATQAGMQTTQ